MRAAHFFLLLGMFFYTNGVAQKKLLPGYIISLTGDTIQGQVDYRNWEQNPKKVSFKPDAGIAIIEYVVTGIREFKVEDEIYESAVVQIEISPANINDLEFDKQLRLEADTVFLQAIIKGRKSFYYYRDKRGKDQFYIKSDSGFELLRSKKYLKLEDDNEVIKTNLEYVNQLIDYLQDCPSIKQNIIAAEYKKKSLERIFQLYYSRCSGDVTFAKKQEKIKTEIGLLAGMSSTKLGFTSIDKAFDYLTEADFKKSTGVSAGVFFDVILPRNWGKWSLNTELLYSGYKVKGTYDLYESEQRYMYNDLTIGMHYIKINNMLRFKYPVGAAFIFVNAGISNGLTVKEVNHRKIDRKFYTTEEIIETKAMDELRKYEQGYLLGLGTRFKRASLEIRYEKGNAMSDYVVLKGTASRLHCLLGFRL